MLFKIRKNSLGTRMTDKLISLVIKVCDWWGGIEWLNIILWVFLIGDVIGAGMVIYNIGKPRILKPIDASIYIVVELIVWIALILKLIGVG